MPDLPIRFGAPGEPDPGRMAPAGTMTTIVAGERAAGRELQTVHDLATAGEGGRGGGGQPRDELLDGEVFHSLAEAKVVIEGWRRHYNSDRPHSALGYRPPAPEAVPWPTSPATRAVAPRPVMH